MSINCSSHGWSGLGITQSVSADELLRRRWHNKPTLLSPPTERSEMAEIMFFGFYTQVYVSRLPLWLHAGVWDPLRQSYSSPGRVVTNNWATVLTVSTFIARVMVSARSRWHANGRELWCHSQTIYHHSQVRAVSTTEDKTGISPDRLQSYLPTLCSPDAKRASWSGLDATCSVDVVQTSRETTYCLRHAGYRSADVHSWTSTYFKLALIVFIP